MANDHHTFDGRVRIPAPSLLSIELEHLLSGQDPTIISAGVAEDRVSVAGYTEWVGAWYGLPISIGWDWGVVDDGEVIVLNPSEIRTNIGLVGNDNQPEPRERATAHLLQWIESKSWRKTAVEPILRALDTPE